MKVLVIVALCLLGYFGWRFLVRGDALVIMGQANGRQASAALKAVSENRTLLIEIHNGPKEGRISEITLDRSLASRLGLSPPAGFREEPLPLSENEKADKESVEFVDSFNRKTLRWVGSLALAPDSTAQLAIPAVTTTDLAGIVSLQYESKAGFGGSLSSLRVDLGAIAASQGPVGQRGPGIDVKAPGNPGTTSPPPAASPA